MNGQASDVGLSPGARGMANGAVQVRQEGPAPSRRQQPDQGVAANVMGAVQGAVAGDRVIRVLTAVVVLAVAGFAAVVSYLHILALGRHHGQDGTAARLLPLSVDGLIAAASLVMLHAARSRLPTPWLARILLGLGVGATIAANVGYGLPFGWLSAVMSAWPAVAFIGSVELAIWVVRVARRSAGATVSVAAGTAADTASSGATSRSDRATGRDADMRENGSGKTPPVDPRRRQRAPTATDRARDILRRNPDLPKADIAKRAGVSVRTVERIIGEARGTSPA